MEIIKINDIQKKPAKGGSLMILKVNGDREATIAPFEKQEQWFLEEEVGIGGSFSGEIVVDGAYTNIKNIDMTSGVKGEVVKSESDNIVKQQSSNVVNDPKHDSIVAQVILKGAVELAVQGVDMVMKSDGEMSKDRMGQILCEAVNELTGAYKLALSNVKAL